MLYAVARTLNGFVGVSKSKEKGKFENNLKAEYSLIDNPKEGSGRYLMNSDSPISIRKISKERYIMSYYNCHEMGRNPLWISGGISKEETILWFQPEIILYNPQGTPFAYSDIGKMEDGDYYITESTKEIGRVHKIPSSFIESLFETLGTGVKAKVKSRKR